MNRVGFLLKVKKEYLKEYKAHHEAVWEDMKLQGPSQKPCPEWNGNGSILNGRS